MKIKRFVFIVFTIIVILSGIWYSSYRKTGELTFAKGSKIYYDNIETIGSFKEAVSIKYIVNINTAKAEELMSLEGIGEKTAEAIILYRSENGSFKTKEEIMGVKGIGEKTFEDIKDFITVEGEE